MRAGSAGSVRLLLVLNRCGIVFAPGSGATRGMTRSSKQLLELKKTRSKQFHLQFVYPYFDLFAAIVLSPSQCPLGGHMNSVPSRWSREFNALSVVT
jgi:hypothetical protein